MDTDARIAQLEELYAQLPTIQCRGKCGVIYCGSIDMTPVERVRILNETGMYITRLPEGPEMCPALGMLGQCTIYQYRPAICRLWGLTQSLQCRFGCMPQGGWISEVSAQDWLVDVKVAGGQATEVEAVEMKCFLRTKEGLATAVEFLLRGMALGLNAWDRRQGRLHTMQSLEAALFAETAVLDVVKRRGLSRIDPPPREGG